MVPALGHLTRGMVHTKATGCLFGICGPLRDFREVHSVSQKDICAEKPLEEVWTRHSNWVRQGSQAITTKEQC